MEKARFTIVTATAGADKSWECFRSWHEHARIDEPQTAGVLVWQGPRQAIRIGGPERYVTVVAQVPDYIGPVPAFKLGVDLALQITAPDGIIACLHDDLLIEEGAWDAKVLAFFNQHPEVGLVGFGGGTGLGADDIYKSAYSPYQLARQDFVSNMREAEAHGRRVTEPTRVACLDGFSQIGRVAFWQGEGHADRRLQQDWTRNGPLTVLDAQGVIHHAYDAYIGADAHRMGWHVYMLPIACHHYGGQTAVGDAGYQLWANARTKVENGDHSLWLTAHHTVYDLLRGVLPIRIQD